jgi:hypothetical protein
MAPQDPKADKQTDLSVHERAEAASAADRAITLQLVTPITHGNTTWTELEMQPLRGRHMRSLPGDPRQITIGNLLEIGQGMAAVPDGIIDDLGPEDIRNVMDVVNAFLGRIQGTED